MGDGSRRVDESWDRGVEVGSEHDKGERDTLERGSDGRIVSEEHVER